MMICTVAVMVAMGGGFVVEAKEILSGKILGQNEASFLMDFSGDPKTKSYSGDYSRVFVRKNDCIKSK